MTTWLLFFFSSIITLVLPTHHAYAEYNPSVRASADRETSLANTGSSNAEKPPQKFVIPQPYYECPPHWGLQLSTSLKTLGGKTFTPQQTQSGAKAFSLLFEYQPSWIQRIGIFSIGPTISIYPFFNKNIASSPVSVFSYGGQIRYQARYFKKQFLVPTLAYSIERMQYDLVQGKQGSAQVRGTTFGLWIFLNSVDTSSAAQFYMNHGVRRSYFILEAKKLEDKKAQVNLKGYSCFFGLRFET